MTRQYRPKPTNKDRMKVSGARLKFLRRTHGLTVLRFCEYVGWTDTHSFFEYENGTRFLPIWRGLMVAEAFNVTLDWLYAMDADTLSKEQVEAGTPYIEVMGT